MSKRTAVRNFPTFSVLTRQLTCTPLTCADRRMPMTHNRPTNSRFYRSAISILSTLIAGSVAVALYLARSRPEHRASLSVNDTPHIVAPKSQSSVSRTPETRHGISYAGTAPLVPSQVTQVPTTRLPPPESERVNPFPQRLDALRQSGRPRPRQMEKVKAVFEEWHRIGAEGRVQFGTPECYGDGCIVTATYKNLDAFHDANHDFQQSIHFRSWQRPKSRSGPTTHSNGEVQAVWILLN